MDAATGYFMTEIRVADRKRAVAWYCAALGLRVTFEDEVGRFTLLEAAGGGRVAIREAEGTAGDRGGVRLVFVVADLDGAMRGLQTQAIAFEGPTASPEGYREIKLRDPDGTPIGLFAWDRGDPEAVR